MFEAGDIVADHVIDAYLGGGSSADVYRAHRPGQTGSVALKILHTDAVSHPRARDRFLREFEIAAKLRHPHIVAMYEQGEVRRATAPRSTELQSFDYPPAPATLWLTMQYVDGPQSSVLIPGAGSEPDLPAVTRAATQIASALDYAHSQDVLHRDVKPANIILTADGENALLTDFGIAQLLDDVKPLASNGRVRGSIAYAAPELLQAQQLSPATDLYALACTVFEWLTGAPPYPRATAFAITYAHLRDPIPTLTARRPWLPSALNSVFAKALAKSAAARYLSCGEFADIVARDLRDVEPPLRADSRRWWQR